MSILALEVCEPRKWWSLDSSRYRAKLYLSQLVAMKRVYEEDDHVALEMVCGIFDSVT